MGDLLFGRLSSGCRFLRYERLGLHLRRYYENEKGIIRVDDRKMSSVNAAKKASAQIQHHERGRLGSGVLVAPK